MSSRFKRESTEYRGLRTPPEDGEMDHLPDEVLENYRSVDSNHVKDTSPDFPNGLLPPSSYGQTYQHMDSNLDPNSSMCKSSIYTLLASANGAQHSI